MVKSKVHCFSNLGRPDLQAIHSAVCREHFRPGVRSCTALRKKLSLSCAPAVPQQRFSQYESGLDGYNSQPRQQVASRERSAAVAPRRRQTRRIRPPSEDELTVSCQTVIDKQVVTRTTGKSLGLISNLCTDPDTLTVVSANLRPKGLALGLQPDGNLLLQTFCQIGDVVLVHDEGALDFVPQDETLGFVDLIGCPVYTSNGTFLGKVREYTFSPDSGRVDLIKYDALGWPSIPERLIGVWQVGVESVQAMEEVRIYLQPRAEEQIMRISNGPLEVALLALQGLFRDAGDSDLADAGRLDPGYEDWKRIYGRQFMDVYGQYPPATRSELENFYQGLDAARSSRSLPPGRQMSAVEALREPSIARAPAGQQRRPLNSSRSLREDPRRRSGQPDVVQRRQSRPSAASEASASSKVASVPIIDRRPPPPYKQRDADGNYGKPQVQEYADSAQPSGMAFDEWVDPGSEDRELVYRGYRDGRARNPAASSSSLQPGSSQRRPPARQPGSDMRRVSPYPGGELGASFYEGNRNPEGAPVARARQDGGNPAPEEWRPRQIFSGEAEQQQPPENLSQKLEQNHRLGQKYEEAVDNSATARGVDQRLQADRAPQSPAPQSPSDLPVSGELQNGKDSTLEQIDEAEKVRSEGESAQRDTWWQLEKKNDSETRAAS